MDAISDFLFARPIALAAACTATCLVLLVLWRRTVSDGRRKAFLGALAVSVVLLVLQEIVVTDRERITALIQELASATAKPDFATIEQALDAAYADDVFNRDTVMPAIRGALGRYRVEGPRVFAFEIRIDGDSADATFNALCDIRESDGFVPNVLSLWRLRLVRHEGRWFVRSIRPVKVGAREVRSLSELFRW